MDVNGIQVQLEAAADIYDNPIKPEGSE